VEENVPRWAKVSHSARGESGRFKGEKKTAAERGPRTLFCEEGAFPMLELTSFRGSLETGGKTTQGLVQAKKVLQGGGEREGGHPGGVKCFWCNARVLWGNPGRQQHDTEAVKRTALKKKVDNSPRLTISSRKGLM